LLVGTVCVSWTIAFREWGTVTRPDFVADRIPIPVLRKALVVAVVASFVRKA